MAFNREDNKITEIDVIIEVLNPYIVCLVCLEPLFLLRKFSLRCKNKGFLDG